MNTFDIAMTVYRIGIVAFTVCLLCLYYELFTLARTRVLAWIAAALFMCICLNCAACTVMRVVRLH